MDSTVRSGGSADLPRPGDFVCGKYRIDSVVGTGGMGVVMGATDTSLGRQVAIKFLSPARMAREGAVARFLREARAAAAIQSEHVVRVYEVGTLPNGAPFIVMEYLRGVDLAQLLAQRGALSIDEACDYILQACEALGEAHGRGIVHRDLKPQNLFLSQRPDGSPCMKVLDFGISKAVDDVASNLTSTDTVMGTPLYMSPEQVRSLKNVDARSDIWSLGAILFELLTMAPVFQAPSASALCAMIAMDPPTPLRARRPQAPPELEAVILRCLHKDPMGRFQDVAALAEALAPFASDRGRLSATRISRVVRGAQGGGGYAGALVAPTASGSGPLPPGSDPQLQQPAFPVSPLHLQAAAPFATTATSAPQGPGAGPPRASFVPGLMPHPGPSQYPPVGHPTTQSTWQQTGAGTQTRTGEGRGGSGVVVAALGVLTGLVLLALVGGGGYWYFVQRETAAAAVPTTAPTAPTAPTALSSDRPVATVATVTPAITTTASSSSAPKPVPTPAARDAGAPSSPKDGGAPAPVPPKPSPTDERFEANKEMHTKFCSHHQMQISRPNVDQATLRQVKTATCLPGNGPDGSRCERDICRQACLLLKDQGCIMQVDYANRAFPPKY